MAEAIAVSKVEVFRGADDEAWEVNVDGKYFGWVSNSGWLYAEDESILPGCPLQDLPECPTIPQLEEAIEGVLREL